MAPGGARAFGPPQLGEDLTEQAGELAAGGARREQAKRHRLVAGHAKDPGRPQNTAFGGAGHAACRLLEIGVRMSTQLADATGSH